MSMLHRFFLGILLSYFFSGPCGLCDLMFVSSTRGSYTIYDLTPSGRNSTNLGTPIQYYSQGVELYFSNTNDANWAEVLLPGGLSFPLIKSVKGQDDTRFQNLTNAVIISNAVLIFSEGASFDTWAEMNQYLPGNQHVTIRFGGGNLGDRHDYLRIVDDSNFFSSPPEIHASAGTLNQLIGFDSTKDLDCSVICAAPWQIGIRDSRHKSVLSHWPLPPNTNLVIPGHLLEPGLVYDVFLYTGTEDLISSNSFAGATRSSEDPQIPMVSSGISVFKSYYIQTKAPMLQLKQRSPSYLSNHMTRMNVEIKSNPGYNALLEFTESLAGSPVWTPVMKSTSFGTNGIGSLVLEKPGDLRSQWSERLFFRVRNSRAPVETPDFMPQP